MSIPPIFSNADYQSGDGFVTKVWGPICWFMLHTISFNYPVHPTEDDKINYSSFIFSLQYTLPCKYCRENLTKNLKTLPLTWCVMSSRHTFSKYVYDLHELVNKMLNKPSTLTFDEVRDRYEQFRSRCTLGDKKKKTIRRPRKEKGCTEPLYGKKSKSVISIVPLEDRRKTFSIDKRCIKRL